MFSCSAASPAALQGWDLTCVYRFRVHGNLA